MLVTVTQCAAVENRTVVEEVAVAFGNRLQPIQETGELRDVVAIDLGEFLFLVRIFPMM